MKKRLLLIAAVLLVSCAAASTIKAETHASQSDDAYPWFITVAGGPQVYFSEYDSLLPFKERISGGYEIGGGKWFLPWLGARAMISLGGVNAATMTGVHADSPYYYPSSASSIRLKDQKFHFLNFHVDALFNLSNVVMGSYKEDRIYKCAPYIGICVVHCWDQPKTTRVAGNVGLYNAFRLAKGWDFNIDLRALVVPDSFNGEVAGRSGEGMLSASFGFTYNFL